MALKRFMRWMADGPRPDEDAIVILPSLSKEYEYLDSLINALLSKGERLSVILLVRSQDDKNLLLKKYPELLVHNAKLVFALTGLSIIPFLRIRCLLSIEGQKKGILGRMFERQATRRGIPAYRLSNESLKSLEKGTVQPEALECLSKNTLKPDGAFSLEDLSKLLIISSGRARDPFFSPDKFVRLLKPFLRYDFSGLLPLKLEKTANLKEHLANPKTILCLGNGPTSTDKSLSSLAYDVLFRVNHQWLEQGYLAQPDMTFTGVKRSMKKFPDMTFGVATPAKEDALLACRLPLFFKYKTVYSVVSELVDLKRDSFQGDYQPTTGAYMLAMAVALEPERLIIAGMDMFNHPEGAYSKSDAVINAYTPAHNFETDADFIVQNLMKYKGELVIYSPALRDVIKDIAPQSGFTLIAPSDLPD